ncbi:hypothetical protein GGR56DRAFT_32938 [Xylariaceae sp. FL0804]|nr:hypothetical protein GGR56DRAFT_32938 [Xylariaceae sp. FL0804]
MSVAPLRCITLGGSLAVMLCGNRQSTLDVDIILDPNVRQVRDYWEEFAAAIRRTADSAGADKQWMNEDVRLFVARDKRELLFLQSVEADIQIYTGHNLVVYAADLSWALETKLRCVGYSRNRKASGSDVDLSDAAALIHLIKWRNGAAPLNVHEVKGYNLNAFDVAPDTHVLNKVARYYFETYGEDGLAEYKLDDETQVWKWKGQDKTWRPA